MDWYDKKLKAKVHVGEGHKWVDATKKRQRFTKELNKYGLRIERDLEFPKNPPLSIRSASAFDDNAWNSSYPVVYIGEKDDKSVGIFGRAVSPSFKEEKDLMKWWKKNKAKAIKKFGDLV